MNQLYPIIRRARRPLLPVDEPAQLPKPQQAAAAPQPQVPEVANGTDATNDKTKADAPESQ